jgi:hypothetical protein
MDDPVALRHASNSLDPHHLDFRRARAQRPRGLVLLRMKIVPRRVIAFELEHDVARSRCALQRFAASAARKRLAPVVSDRLGRRGGVARVGVGLGDISTREMT